MHTIVNCNSDTSKDPFSAMIWTQVQGLVPLLSKFYHWARWEALRISVQATNCIVPFQPLLLLSLSLRNSVFPNIFRKCKLQLLFPSWHDMKRDLMILEIWSAIAKNNLCTLSYCYETPPQNYTPTESLFPLTPFEGVMYPSVLCCCYETPSQKYTPTQSLLLLSPPSEGVVRRYDTSWPFWKRH